MSTPRHPPRTLVFLARSFIRLCSVLSQVIQTQNDLTFHMIALEKKQRELERRIRYLETHNQ